MMIKKIILPIIFALTMVFTMMTMVGEKVYASNIDDFNSLTDAEHETIVDADHIIGKDVGGEPYTIIQPGQTIGVKIKAEMSTDVYGWLMGYDIWALDDITVDTTYLHSDTTLQKDKLSLLGDEPRHVVIPYSLCGTGTLDSDSSLADFYYENMYRNDTGLPLLLYTGGMKVVMSESGWYVVDHSGYGANPRVSATVNYYGGAKLYALETSYPITVTAANSDNTSSSGVTEYALDTLYWPNGTPSFPNSFVVDGAVHTYTLQNPVRKGSTFFGWNFTRTESDGNWWRNWFGLERPQYVGEQVSNGEAATAIRNAADTVLTVDMMTHMNTYNYPKYNGPDSVMADVHFNAYFNDSDYAHTVGFNPEGGKVNGKSYEMMELATSVRNAGVSDRLDIGTVVPVRSGHTFMGWCTDKDDPKGTLITDTAPENAGAWKNSDGTRHTELYAVWQKNVQKVRLNKDTMTIDVNNSKTLTADVLPQDAGNKKVTWKSEDEEVATVDDSGKVIAKKAGKTTITVTTDDGKKTATCKVTVVQPVTKLELNKKSITLSTSESNNTETLEVTISPSDATNENVTWESSNTAVATVDSNGKVTAKKVGTAIITVTAADGSGEKATCEVTVKQPVTKVALSKTSLTLYTLGSNNSATLTATVTPSNASNKKVTWTSSNTAVATVSSSGKVTAKKAGTVTITATAADGSKKAATCKVTVKEWTADIYNISYQNLNGASNSNPTTYTVADTITLAALPNVTGYTFNGWYDNATFSGSPVTGITANSTGDKTFYAKWTEISYYNAKGNGGEWTKGSGSALTFIFKRSVDDETTFDHFIGIEVDGKAIPEKESSGKANWTAKSGSVIIELLPAYLETLSVGAHKLTVKLDDDADATATFTVKAKPATPTVTPTKTPTKTATSGKATTTAPKTGDESNMLLWFLLICASLFVMFQIISLRNRRFYDR